MSRRRLFTALMLSGLLLLAACSSGQPAGGAATVRVASTVRFGYFTQQFATPLPASPAQAAVVEGLREGLVQWEDSANSWHLSPRTRDYVTGDALKHLDSVVRASRSNDMVPAGADRLYMTRVTSVSGRSATVVTCDDGSRFEQVNPRTRKLKVGYAPIPSGSYVTETWRMVRLGGHWAIGSFTVASLPSPSAEPCQPDMSGVTLVHPPAMPVLFREMNVALRSARSVYISGTVRQQGKTLGLNLAFTRSGDLSGQISENGAQITILATHGHTYVKLSAAFFKLFHLNPVLCSDYCGRYLEAVPAQAQQFFGGVRMGPILKSITGVPSSKVSYAGEVIVGGQPAWLLQDQQHDSLFVAARGKPYPVKVVGAPGSSGTLTLSQWNAVHIPPPPPANQIVNPSQLTQAQ